MGKAFVLRGIPRVPYEPTIGQKPKPETHSAQLGKKKRAGSRLWMRIDTHGSSELLECDRQTIIRRASVPARDLRILGPVFSHSFNILAREKATVINLEFIKAIITAEEVFILDPTSPSVKLFVQELQEQLQSSAADLKPHEPKVNSKPLSQDPLQRDEGAIVEMPEEFPFEFRVLETALDAVCNYLAVKVSDLEETAYPALDALTKRISTNNLEHVRSLKSRLTHLTAHVQKVRDEVEHLLDNDEDMADMCLTSKLKWQIGDSPLHGVEESNSFLLSRQVSRLSTQSSNCGTSAVMGTILADNSVEELEMLLEAYFMQIDGTRNKLLALREYIEDTEDYINIQLDNQRNKLLQLQLIIIIVGFVVSIATAVAGAFGMNIPYGLKGNAFVPTIVGTLFLSTFVLFLIFGYAQWKEKLLHF